MQKITIHTKQSYNTDELHAWPAAWARNQLGLHHAALMINHATDQLRYNLGSEPPLSMWGGLHFPFAQLQPKPAGTSGFPIIYWAEPASCTLSRARGAVTIMATGNDELKCGICLELFQDPRTLPCLHTFCRECIQRSLNENHSLKCPVCRAKHELSNEGAGLLPVNQYTLQEPPLKRLQQPEDNGGQQDECKSCGEQAPVVAWCEDCDTMICRSTVLESTQKVSCLA